MRRFFVHCLALGLLGCALRTDVRLRKMPDGGMEPTIRREEVIRENFDAIAKRPLARFDLVTVKEPDRQQTTIRRIIALPGETVRVRGHRATVNGRPLAEPFARIETVAGKERPPANFGPLSVPAGQYFLLGDNRVQGRDSRTWRRPTVPASNIVARIER
jgi:signal peptidase I